MRIGISEIAFCDEETKIVDYKCMKEYGFDYADTTLLTLTDGELYQLSEKQRAEEVLKVKKTAEDAGIGFYQCHGPWPVDDTSPERRKITLEHMKTAIRGYSLLGAQNFVLHPVMPYAWGPETDSDFAWQVNAEYMSELCDYAKDYNMNICLENMPAPHHKLAVISNIVEFVDSLKKDNMCICFDTGHANYTEHDCGEMVRLCGNRLKAVHIHDNDGRYDTHILPYDGEIDWENFKNALHEVKFDGVVSLETGGKALKCPPAVRDAFRKVMYETAKYFAQ